MEVAYEMCRYKKAGMKIWGNEIKRSYEKEFLSQSYNDP